MKLLEYLAIRFWVLMFLCLLSSPFAFVLAVVLHVINGNERWIIIEKILCLIALIWVGFILWLIKPISTRIVFEKKTIKQAAREAFYEAQLKLAFWPVIGRFFLRKREKDDDDK